MVMRLPLRLLVTLVFVGAVEGATPVAAQNSPAKPKPLLRDFIGLNVHTVQFKPELYQPVTKRLRDYHPFDWDVGNETDYYPRFPFARNQVDWGGLYGAWKKAG